MTSGSGVFGGDGEGSAGVRRPVMVASLGRGIEEDP